MDCMRVQVLHTPSRRYPPLGRNNRPKWVALRMRVLRTHRLSRGHLPHLQSFAIRTTKNEEPAIAGESEGKEIVAGWRSIHLFDVDLWWRHGFPRVQRFARRSGRPTGKVRHQHRSPPSCRPEKWKIPNLCDSGAALFGVESPALADGNHSPMHHSPAVVRTYILFPSKTSELRKVSSELRASSLYSRPGSRTMVAPLSLLT